MKIEQRLNKGFILTPEIIEKFYHIALDIYKLNNEDIKDCTKDKKIFITVNLNTSDVIKFNSVDPILKLDNYVEKINELSITTSIAFNHNFFISFNPDGIYYRLEIDNDRDYQYFKNKIQNLIQSVLQEFPENLLNSLNPWMYFSYIISLLILNHYLLEIIPNNNFFKLIPLALIMSYYIFFPVIFGNKLYPKNIFLINRGEKRYARLKTARNLLIFSPLSLLFTIIPNIISFLKLLIESK